ncbi:alpha/beta fold hydrolase [Micromonospora mirobrigensis]|nr:alpha/beta hydrolase [Micromonospora mirobrigensis]
MTTPGGRAPAVLLCPGMGEGADTWDRLVPLLVGAVTVLDRAAGGPAPTLAGEVARIAALADDRDPVLVAHSAGALAAEAYARLHPGRVAGLVLVDPSVVRPGTTGRLRAATARLLTAGTPVLAGALDRAGLPGRLGPWAWRRAARRMGEGPADPVHAAAYGQPTVLVRLAVEWLAHPALAVELLLLRERTAAPTVPVRVLTALGDVASARGRVAWRTAHARLAESFSAGRQEVLRDARHLVHRDRPEVVAAAVTAVGRDSGS